MSRYIGYIVSLVIANTVVFSIISKLLMIFQPGLYVAYTYSTYLLSIFLLIFQFRKYGLAILNKPFMAFIIVYCIYIYYYSFISPKMNIYDLAYTPHDQFSFFLRSFMLFSLLLSSETIVKHFRVDFFLLTTVTLCLLVSFWYINSVSLASILSKGDDEDFVGPMAIGYANAPIFTISIIQFFNSIDKNTIKSVLYICITVLSGYVVFAMAERGPIIFSLITLFICYYYRKVNSTKTLFFTATFLIILYVNIDNILECIGYFFPDTTERLSQALEGDTNGRLTTQSGYDGVYVLGFNEFLKNPIWGSYFRIYGYGIFSGSYPHNIFIELLMTMGVIGFIPFMVLFIKTFKKCHNSFRYSFSQKKEIFLVFCLLSSIKLLVSGTIVFNIPFWTFLYIMSNVDNRMMNKSFAND